MTDEQLQKLISFKVKQATEPFERRWESLRRCVDRWKTERNDWRENNAYESVLYVMDCLHKPETETEPRRKLPTDPRRKVKK